MYVCCIVVVLIVVVPRGEDGPASQMPMPCAPRPVPLPMLLPLMPSLARDHTAIHMTAALAVILAISTATALRALKRTARAMGTRSVQLSNARGVRMPLLGLGTWQAPKGEVGKAVTDALACGYRHIDCAACYGNEAEVGEALAAAFDGGLRRSALFVTSKLWNSEHRPEHVRPALLKTLQDLKLKELDLFVIHWPLEEVMVLCTAFFLRAGPLTFAKSGLRQDSRYASSLSNSEMSW